MSDYQTRIEPSLSGQSQPVQSAPPAQANMRDESDFNRAKRHSHLVGTLRKALPITAAVWGTLFFLNATFSLASLPDIAVESAGIEGGKLVMNAPVMSGFDKQNRPFDVKASRAIQDLANSSVVDLENIDALLPMDAKSKARIIADFGKYDTDAETMVLRDNIMIKGARGMDISLNSADINMKAGTMKSDKGVVVSSKDFNISADTISVEDNGKRIVFKKRVKTTITRVPKK